MVSILPVKSVVFNVVVSRERSKLSKLGQIQTSEDVIEAYGSSNQHRADLLFFALFQDQETAKNHA